MLFTGYLKATRVRMEGARTIATLAIPNIEVQYAYETLIRSWLEQRLGPTQVEELLRAVLAGDAKRVSGCSAISCNRSPCTTSPGGVRRASAAPWGPASCPSWTPRSC